MQRNFTFLKGGTVAFYRSDAEQADWTQEEMSLICTFPLNEKVIERGMTVLFADPATNAIQAYEIRNLSTFRAEGYQQFTAEDIVISELTDCHIPEDIELTNVSATTALNRILSGTGWSVGNVASNPTSTADIGRGSVWQGAIAIRNNWNINFLTRVTIGTNGITGKYIDIVTTGGTWRGLRLSIDKNTADPCVTYDDSELYTALYAYGASYTEGSTLETQHTVETTIAGVTWSKTSDHPAKPSGQKYLEWPEKTALYGRNGRPRFGYYQNTDIKDANVLIQKCWETLKTCSEPKVSITGTVTDLRRMGYADEPLRLYDMAIVDFGDVIMYKQVIKLTVNLLDPTGNTPTIGDYIPSIIYINRETENYATGGSAGVGGRGGGGGSRNKKKQGEFETSILQNERNIILEARQVDENRNILRQAGMQIDPITGVLIYAEDTQNMIGSKFHVQSDRITSEVTERKASDNLLSSRITQNANSISLEVSERKGADNNLSSRITVTAREIRSEVTDVDNRLSSRITQTSDAINAEVSRATSAEGSLSGRITVEAGRINQIVTAVGSDGQVTAASICLAVNSAGSSATINADKIYLLGQTITNTITADYITTKIASASRITAQALLVSGVITCQDGISCVAVYANNNNITNPIMEASVSGNTLTLTKADGTTAATFSKATTLSGDWSGSYQDGKNYVVTAKQNGVTVGTKESPVVNSVAKYGSPSWSAGDATYDQQVLVQDSAGNSIYLGTIDVKSIYTSGRNSVSISSLGVYGDPAATATSITIQAIASNGASTMSSVNITSQRNNAYNSGVSDTNALYTHRYTGTLYTNGTISAGNGSWYTKSS